MYRSSEYYARIDTGKKKKKMKNVFPGEITWQNGTIVVPLSRVRFRAAASKVRISITNLMGGNVTWREGKVVEQFFFNGNKMISHNLMKSLGVIFNVLPFIQLKLKKVSSFLKTFQ